MGAAAFAQAVDLRQAIKEVVEEMVGDSKLHLDVLEAAKGAEAPG